MTVHVLLVDNLDSFSFNLADELAKRGAVTSVVRSTLATDVVLDLARRLPRPRLVVISPGPGSPEEAGCSVEVIRRAGEIPIFGVCLGLQAMAVALGGEVGPAGELVHGKSSLVTHQGGVPFDGLPSPLAVGRYHSLVAVRLPTDLVATAHAGELVMAARGTARPLVGVQFHPESILTPHGGAMVANVLAWASTVEGAR